MVQTNPMMPFVCAIVGPTGVGKSRLALAIANTFSAEILSADAFQFYRNLNIGTAKLSHAEQAGIPHHFLDILDPSETFSVHDYQIIARDRIDRLLQKGILPLLVGGSGLYVNSVYYDYRFSGNKRQVQDDTLTSEPTDLLYERLKAKNNVLAATIHPNNRRRILRSLEIADAVASSRLNNEKTPHYPRWLSIGLTMPRERLYRRLEERVDHMMAAGLEGESRFLYEHAKDSQAAMAIGYKEFFPYFQGDMSLEDVVSNIKQNTRRYAKRQLTWFRNQMDCTWFTVDPDDFDETVEQVLTLLKKTARSGI